MKNRLIVIAIAFSASLLWGGCSDFFPVRPGHHDDMSSTFSSRLRTEQWLSSLYNSQPDDVTGERWYNNTADRYGGIWMSGSLEGNITWDWHNSHKWNNGSLDAGSEEITFWWGHYYKAIAKASIFIENVDSNPELTADEKKLYKAEARGLRAMYYFFLFRTYGPFVLLRNSIPIDAPKESMLLPRSSVDDCVKFMAEEFDLAAADLPPVVNASNARYGHLDKGQCKAYKAKMLLYAASPLFNGNALMAGVKNPDGTQLIPSTVDQTKWETARDAFKEFMDEFVPVHYDLHVVKTADGKTDFYESYRQITQSTYIESKENISGKTVWHGDLNYAITPYHQGYKGRGVDGGMGACVSQEFVDMFFTDKGLRTVDDTDYRDYGINAVPSADHYGWPTDYNDPVVPSRNYFKANENRTLKQWADREPRFYVCVTYNGSTWLNTTSNYGQITTELTYNGNSGFATAGHDSPYTGYGWRKTARSGAEPRTDAHISCNLRLADLYLGYAEALNECDDIPNAIRYVNLVRARAGVPEYGTGTDDNGKERIAYPANKTEVRNRIRRERLIELALEANHFFDVRRWMVADMAVGDNWIYPAYHRGGEGGAMHGLSNREDAPNFFRKVEFQQRVFQPKHYFMPIPNAEVLRDPLMVQNHDWGTIKP